MISGHAPPVMDGVGDCTAPLLAEIARQRPDWRFTWLTRRPGWFRAPVVVGDGYRLVRPNHSWTPRGRAVACRTLRWLKPDLVHIQEQIHSFFETDAAERLARAARCPVVTTLHEYHVELPSVVHTDGLVRLSTAIIANDARNAARCLQRTGRESVRLWSGSTVTPLQGAATVDPEVLTTFGFLSGLKAVELPFLAIQRLRAMGYPLRWRLIGPFDPTRNPDHARLTALSEHAWIEFTGGFSVEDDRLRRLLSESRMMLLPYADGASLRRTTLHAAWAFGIPTITTPPPEPEPAIVDGENCLLVSEPTPEAWAEAIHRVLNDRALSDRLSANGRATAEAFGWPALARRHLELYDRLLAEHAEGRRS